MHGSNIAYINLSNNLGIYCFSSDISSGFLPGMFEKRKKIQKSFKFECLKWPIFAEITAKNLQHILIFFANKGAISRGGSGPPPPPGRNPALDVDLSFDFFPRNTTVTVTRRAAPRLNVNIFRAITVTINQTTISNVGKTIVMIIISEIIAAACHHGITDTS